MNERTVLKNEATQFFLPAWLSGASRQCWHRMAGTTHNSKTCHRRYYGIKMLLLRQGMEPSVLCWAEGVQKGGFEMIGPSQLYWNVSAPIVELMKIQKSNGCLLWVDDIESAAGGWDWPAFLPHYYVNDSSWVTIGYLQADPNTISAFDFSFKEPFPPLQIGTAWRCEKPTCFYLIDNNEITNEPSKWHSCCHKQYSLHPRGVRRKNISTNDCHLRWAISNH